MIRFLLICGLACAALRSAAADDLVAAFSDPVKLTAGEADMGQGILYPSPKLHDLNGDGVAELLIGDLRGRLLFAKRLRGAGEFAWSDLEPLLTADGEPIKFDNW